MNPALISCVSLCVPLCAEIDYSVLPNPMDGREVYKYSVEVRAPEAAVFDNRLAQGDIAGPRHAFEAALRYADLNKMRLDWQYDGDAMKVYVLAIDGSPVRGVSAKGKGPVPQVRLVVWLPEQMRPAFEKKPNK